MKWLKTSIYLFIFAIVLVACGNNSMAYRRKHGGYDSQNWIPKKHYPYYYNKKAR
ncbi:MAG: hypothetical protein MUC49_08750 [Raineya sp.]|jgi:hypothetical protein|nr:hypothetical protein [Raineya sp.]